MNQHMVTRLNLDKHLIDKLSKANLKSTGDILGIYTPFELGQKLDVCQSAVEQILNAASRASCPLHQTVAGLRENRNASGYLSTGIPLLDRALRGGIPQHSLCEIAGKGATGKTQLCLWLTLQAVAPKAIGGAGGDAVFYFDTENGFSSSRLYELASSRFKSLSEADFKAMLRKIRIFKVSRPAELDQLLSESLERLVVSHNPSLILLDSISRFYFSANTFHSAVERHDALQTKATIFKRISESFGVPTVVTNDISRVQETFSVSRQTNAWSHSVNTRLVLESYTAASAQVSKIKRLSVVKSPVAAPSILYFTISSTGIKIPD